MNEVTDEKFLCYVDLRPLVTLHCDQVVVSMKPCDTHPNLLSAFWMRFAQAPFPASLGTIWRLKLLGSTQEPSPARPPPRLPNGYLETAWLSGRLGSHNITVPKAKLVGGPFQQLAFLSSSQQTTINLGVPFCTHSKHDKVARMGPPRKRYFWSVGPVTYLSVFHFPAFLLFSSSSS